MTIAIIIKALFFKKYLGLPEQYKYTKQRFWKILIYFFFHKINSLEILLIITFYETIKMESRKTMEIWQKIWIWEEKNYCNKLLLNCVSFMISIN